MYLLDEGFHGISPPELTATNSTICGIISLAPFCTTSSPSSLQSGDSEPDMPLDFHLHLHLITFPNSIQIQDCIYTFVEFILFFVFSQLKQIYSPTHQAIRVKICFEYYIVFVWVRDICILITRIQDSCAVVLPFAYQFKI
jgi:hypothetical protein